LQLWNDAIGTTDFDDVTVRTGQTSVPPPTVSAINPTSGPAAGGTVVTITGTGFSTTAGATTVRFGATSATGVSCASTTSCSATSPAGSGAVDVTVTVSGLTSATSAADVFTYNATGPIFSDGFESGTLAAWDGTIGPGTISVTSAAARTGAFGLRLADSSSSQYAVVWKRLSTPLNDSFTRFSVRFTGLTGSTTVAYGRDESSNSVRWILYYNASSQSFDYFVFNGSGASTGISTAAGSAALGAWLTVELRYTGTTTGGGQIWINGVTQPSWSASGNFSTTAPYQRLQLWNDAIGTTDFDDVTVRAP
jgi:hypothetical protein